MNAISFAVNYLARFARTELQLRRYLQRKGFSPNEISEALVYLHDHQFLNDDAYAQSYIASRIARLDGPLKIKQLLMQKGIAPARADVLLREQYSQEQQLENARKLARKKSRTKQQLQRFIASRGYPPYVIRAMTGPLRHEGED